MSNQPINPVNNSTPCAAIILAAGKSTRMKSKRPKPLHELCGLSMTGHVIRACRKAGVERIIVVVGHEADLVKSGLGPDVEFAIQTTQRGTGDAVKSAAPLLQDWPGTVLVLAGDTPLITSDCLSAVLQRQSEADCPLAILTAFLPDATGYGRIQRNESGDIIAIVEERDATPEQRLIKEWNPSVYVFKSRSLWTSLDAIENTNAQNEFYLTDTVRIISESGTIVQSAVAKEPLDLLGVNTRVELAEVDKILRTRINREHMLAGVTMVDPLTTYIGVDVIIGEDTVLFPNTYIYPGSRIGAECSIGPSTTIKNSKIGFDTIVLCSQIVDSEIGDHVKVGPFANLRPGTKLGDKVKIGDFVELKNAKLGEGTQVSHLSYIGDADIGTGVNVGAGAITCNYDGFAKHRTTVGRNAFVGSNSTLIAPVVIGEGALIAAGSIVPSGEVPGNSMFIARPLPTIKPDWAKRFRENKRNK